MTDIFRIIYRKHLKFIILHSQVISKIRIFVNRNTKCFSLVFNTWFKIKIIKKFKICFFMFILNIAIAIFRIIAAELRYIISDEKLEKFYKGVTKV